MKFTWLTILIKQKSVILMAMPVSLTAYIPTRVSASLDDTVFVLIGWIFAMLLTIIEYRTSWYDTKKDKELGRKELWSKIMVYTSIFFVLKFFQVWVEFENHEIIGGTISFFVLAAYAIIWLGEFKFIGKNLEKRYKNKPSIFRLFDKIETALINMIGKRIESGCNLEPKDSETTDQK